MPAQKRTRGTVGGSLPDPTVRDRVLDAVVALIAERGLINVSVDDIARTAGVSKTTMYTRWPDRASLIRSAFERVGQLRDAGAETQDVTFDEALDLLFARTVPAPHEVLQITVELMARAGVDDEMRALLENNQRQWRAVLERVIQRGIDEGVVPAERDVALTARVVTAVVTQEQVGRRGDPDELRATVRRLIVDHCPY